MNDELGWFCNVKSEDSPPVIFTLDHIMFSKRTSRTRCLHWPNSHRPRYQVF